MPFQTDKDLPIYDPNDPEQKRDISRIYINHTKGVWLRHNTQEHTIELWYDGMFQSSWKDTNLGEVENGEVYLNIGIVSSMISDGIEIGERKRADAIVQLLRGLPK